MEKDELSKVALAGEGNEILFRQLEDGDIPNVLKLMIEISPNIGGARYPSLYHALCRESLIDKRVVFIVGEEQSDIVAFHIAIIDRDKWRKSFMMRHPLILARMAFSRIYHTLRRVVKKAIHQTKGLPKPIANIDDFVTPGNTNRSWKDSSPKIAKIIFTGVAESQRGKRIIKSLYEYRDQVLAKRGVKRVDSVILSDNIKMIRASVRLGVSVYKSDGHLMTTKNL